MITIPAALERATKSGNLTGLKPFALLYRNKWDSDNNVFALESTPIDISEMIVKPNTLSMTLDVNEIAQYNANNVTLTLSDPHNKFIEGVPGSYFPDGYQLYGSKVVLYYGFSEIERTPIFIGVIKELPTHKPNKYQVDLKLVSPLELLKDIEARDFSNKVTGETLTLDHIGDNNEEYYITANEGVGGITALYANGVKLYEGVDYNVSDLNDLALPAMIEVVNGSVFGQTFTADYYYWKRALAIEDIVGGLVALGGYDAATEDIQPVVWTSQVRNPPTISPVLASIGYYEDDADEYKFSLNDTANNSWADASNDWTRQQIFCKNFDFSFKITLEGKPTTGSGGKDNYISFGDELGTGYGVKNGFAIVENFVYFLLDGKIRHRIYKISNNTPTLIYELEQPLSEVVEGIIVYNTTKDYKIEQRNGTVTIYQNGSLFATITSAETNLNFIVAKRDVSTLKIENQAWSFYDDNLTLVGANLSRPCIITETLDKTLAGITWGAIQADLGELDGQTYFLTAYFSDDGLTWGAGTNYNLDTDTAHQERYMYYILGISNAPGMSFDITDPSTYFYATNLVLNMVNLGNSTVLEALQDLSLISGYEFGVDRNGVFFFRPRTDSTTPIYELDHSELVSVENVKKNLNDFFTKLTLTFSQIPLEFYANDGTRPTAIDKYGVINKDIDKPDIVNYDNPELAQAIGPQLLAIYSTARDNIQAVGKLNLALELGDIVNLKRNYPLTASPEESEYDKFARQDTYCRACKITGLNYNFDKRQITYTLRDVSNENNAPSEQDNLAYIYENPVELG